MKIKKQFLSVAMMAVCLLTMMSSCSLSSQDENKTYSYVQAVPYVQDYGGDFGMMDLNGVSIISPRYYKLPTEASCDRFFVIGDDDLWELYTLEANPKRIGTTKYISVGAFVDGLCPVTEPGSTPIYINTEGEKVFEADHYIDDDGNSKRIISAGNFQDGKAIIIGENELRGFIDKEGNVIVKPKYLIAINYKHGFALAVKPPIPGSEYKQEWVILDSQGNETFSARIVDMHPIQDAFDGNDRLLVMYDKDYMFINSKGEEVQALESDAVTEVKDAYNGLMKFYNSNYKFGLINADGKIIVKPRYDEIAWAGGLIAAKKEHLSDFIENDEEEYTILNTDGEVLKTLRASSIWMPDYRYKGYTNRLCCYKDSTDSHSYGYFIGEDGEKLPSSITFNYVSTGATKLMADTDYNIEDLFVNHLKFTKEGFAGFKYNEQYKDMDFSNTNFKILDGNENVGTLSGGPISSLHYISFFTFDRDMKDEDGEINEDGRLLSWYATLKSPDLNKLHEKIRARLEEVATLKGKKHYPRYNGEIFDAGNGLSYFLSDTEVGFLYLEFGKFGK